MDPVQILLFVVATVLTLALLVLGVEVFFILRESYRALKKLNKVLEDAESISSAVSKPILGFASFVEGIKNFKKIAEVFKGEGDGSSQVASFDSPTPFIGEEEKDFSPEGEHAHIESLQERGRRFFHKDGKPLTS